MICVGIDMLPENMTIAEINDNGELHNSKKIACHKKALLLFFGDLGKPIQDVVEATASWCWISDCCRRQHIRFSLAHSKMHRAISYAKVKTDTVDARILVELLRAGLIPKAWQVERYQRDLRELTRARLRLVQRRICIQIKNTDRCATTTTKL